MKLSLPALAFCLWPILSGFAGELTLPQEAAQVAHEKLKAARAAFTAASKNFKDVAELHADYVQEQESLLLDEPISSTGRIYLRTDPGCLVLKLEKPRPLEIRSDEKSHQIYYPDKGRAERFLFEKNELAVAMISCLSADLSAVEEVFKISDCETAKGEVAGAGKSLVTLVPKEESLRLALPELRVEFDLELGLPTRIFQVNREGETVRFELSGMKLLKEADVALEGRSAAIFDAPLPADTRVVETVVKAEKRRSEAPNRRK